MSVNAAQLTRAIEHTLLRAEATPQEIDALCDEALHYGFGAVCVNPIYVARASRRLASANQEKRPIVVAAVGFPLGASLTAIKADEAQRAIDDGAMEIDMVAALGALVVGDAKSVRRDIEAVARVVHQSGGRRLLKVILEAAALSTDQLILGCRCCAEGEADFVKTSTGFHPRGGATVEHVRQLHRHAAPLRIKAAGGIRSADAAIAMMEAGAERIGTSAGVTIVERLRASTA